MKENMLVIAPHVDDAEFGIGGWIHRVHRQDLGKVTVVIAASGSYTRSDGQHVDWGKRMMEAHDALEHLGVRSIIFADLFHENQGLSTRFDRLVSNIESYIHQIKPTELFMPLSSFNQDHDAVKRACITATRPGMWSDHLKHVWAYPYPGNCWMGDPLPQFGKCYLGLSEEDVQAKREALYMHKSQFEGRAVAVGPEASLAQVRTWGLEAGLDYAEVVYLMREVLP